MYLKFKILKVYIKILIGALVIKEGSSYLNENG